MSVTGGVQGLHFAARINNSQLSNDAQATKSIFRDIGQNIKQTGQEGQQEMDKLGDSLKKVGAGLAVYFSAGFAKNMIAEIASVRGEFQDLHTSFETILASKEKADKLMMQVVQFAATTPFNLRDVAGGTKQLLAYGFAADGMIGNLRMLGDVAAGTSTPIADLIYLYGTLNTQGRAYTKDIMQFTGRGIPIIGELAKQFGVAKDEVMKMVEAGKVGFPEVEKSFPINGR